ncbi:MAG: hypothetical protein H7296_13830 [Bacteroidia bacterium]|nr:hypothetical protein [Bacteroidia bacterium]
MKKSIIISFAVICCLLLASACKKENESTNTVINVTLEPNKAYSYNMDKLGDDDDQVQITTEASHSLISRITPVANSTFTLFEYTPVKDYVGTDEVVVSAVEPTHNKGGKGGKCGKHNHEEESNQYTFKINIKASSE